MLLEELNYRKGRGRMPPVPVGVVACTHPACIDPAHKSFFLDLSSPNVQAAFNALPEPLSNLTPAALQLVLHALPLHACARLAAPLQFISLHAHVVIESSVGGSMHVIRPSRSLNLSHAPREPQHLAYLLRFIPLLPRLQSLDLSNSCSLDHPFPKRKKWFDPNPPDPKDRATVALWKTLATAMRVLAPSLTHLSLAYSTIDRSALSDISSTLTRLRSLDITELAVSAPPRFRGYGLPDMHADIVKCVGRLPRCMEKLQARYHPKLQEMSSNSHSSGLSIQYLTHLTHLEFSNHGLSYRHVDVLGSMFTRHLSALTRLELLDLSGNPFCCLQHGDAVEFPAIFLQLFRALDAMHSLRKLRIRETGLLEALQRVPPTATETRGSVRPFYEYLSRMKNLTSLDISNSLSHEQPRRFEAGWKCALAPAIGSLYHLRELHASCAGLTLQSAAALVNELTRITCLEVLNLSGNELAAPMDARRSVSGLVSATSAARTCRSSVAEAVSDATERDVDAGAAAQVALLQSLACMPRLRVLNLSSCKLSFLAAKFSRGYVFPSEGDVWWPYRQALAP